MRLGKPQFAGKLIAGCQHATDDFVTQQQINAPGLASVRRLA
jgi:hypothetical protein